MEFKLNTIILLWAMCCLSLSMSNPIPGGKEKVGGQPWDSGCDE